MQKYKLLIETDDQKGLVCKVSKIIFENNLNVEINSEFVDKQNNKFFMRTVFSGEVNCQQMLSELREALPNNSEIKLVDSSKKNIIILATKEIHCLGDLLIKHVEGKLDANITAVISNYNNLRGFVEKFDIPFEHISHEGINREEHESRVCDVIKTYQHDVIVLAKYMRILSPSFVGRFKGKLLNIHHSFLPAFIGANPYKQAYERGVKIIGATSHFVTDDLDKGPIIVQDIIRVDHSYSWQVMRDAGHDVEKNVLSTALNLVLKDKIFVFNNKTIIL